MNKISTSIISSLMGILVAICGWWAKDMNAKYEKISDHIGTLSVAVAQLQEDGKFYHGRATKITPEIRDKIQNEAYNDK